MEGEVDPLSGFNYLLDLMGINSVKYNRTMREHLSEEFGIFSEMTDSEKQAYWTQKENDYLVNKQESARKKSEEAQALTERDQRVTQLREAHGVSEDDY